MCVYGKLYRKKVMKKYEKKEEEEKNHLERRLYYEGKKLQTNKQTSNTSYTQEQMKCNVMRQCGVCC